MMRTLSVRSVIPLIVVVLLLAVSCSSETTDTTTTTLDAATITTTSTVTTTVPVPTTAASPVTIMPMGDSHTQGATGWGTYRCYLDAMLRDAGIAFDFIGTQSEPHGGEPYGCPTDFDQDHEAAWGSVIRRLSDAATPSVETLQPDVALVLIGGNDLDLTQDPAIVAKDLETFIIGLQAVSPDLTVLVAQLMPCNMPLPKCSEPYAVVNDLIASFDRLSTDESSVVVVDLATGLDPDYYQDAVHMNEEGDKLLAGRWMTALQESGVISPSK